MGTTTDAMFASRIGAYSENCCAHGGTRETKYTVWQCNSLENLAKRHEAPWNTKATNDEN
jgi:hypothetical protein